MAMLGTCVYHVNGLLICPQSEAIYKNRRDTTL